MTKTVTLSLTNDEHERLTAEARREQRTLDAHLVYLIHEMKRPSPAPVPVAGEIDMALTGQDGAWLRLQGTESLLARLLELLPKPPAPATDSYYGPG